MDQVEAIDNQQEPQQVEVKQEVKTPEIDFRSTKHRVKVDGEELEIPYDDLLSGYNLNRVSDKRLKEAAKMRKDVESFVSRLSDGDLSLLEEFVPKEKLRGWAEKELTEYVQWEELPEYEKKRIIAEQERDKVKKELELRDKRDSDEKYAIIDQQVALEIDNEISDAIESLRKTSGFEVPVTAELVQDIARLMLSQLQDGDERMTAKSATEKIWDRYRKKFGSYVSSLSASDLKGILTPSQLKALRKEELEEAMSSMSNNIRQFKSDGTEKKKKTEKIDVDSFFKQLDKKFYGR